MQCTAWSKQNNRRCHNKAVIGYNVCRMHGAGNIHKGKKGGRPVEHGMYSNKVNTDLEGLYDEFLDSQDNVSALNDDIALMRAMMITSLKEKSNTPEGKQAQANQFLKYMRDIRYAIELKDDIESKFMVSIETVQIFLNQLIFILKKHIKDEDLLMSIMEDMRKVKLLDQDTSQPRLLRDKNRKR
jgi:hypothetical protein